MDLTKVEALFKEFTFLNKYTDKSRITNGLVSRIDADLLAKFVRVDFGTDSGTTRFVLLDKEGGKLAEVGVEERKASDNIKWYRPMTWVSSCAFSETIGEALLRLGERAAAVHYVLEIRIDYGSGQDKNESYGRFLVIHKPPKTFSVVGWIVEQHRRAEERLKAELKEIDSEAD